MRRRISLYIGDKLVEMDDLSFVLFNHTMDDLSNPTVIRNSYSQQISIPGTPNNNKLFGHLYRFDRQTSGPELYRWNQLFNLTTPGYADNCTYAITADGYTIMARNTSGNATLNHSNFYPSTPGHKYLICGEFKSSAWASATSLVCSVYGEWVLYPGADKLSTTDWNFLSTIHTTQQNGSIVGYFRKNAEPTGAPMQIRNFCLFDLTAMDIADEINSFADFEVWCEKRGINLSQFSPYDPGSVNPYKRKDTGNQFNPLNKVPFRIYNEMSELIESGYCKVDGVVNTNGRVTYKVSLFGGLGSFLSTLKFKNEGELLTLADLTYSSGAITYKGDGLRPDASMVDSAWKSLREGGEGLFSILNFIPADNGYPEGFDPKKAVFDGLPVNGIYDWNNMRSNSVSGYSPRGDWGSYSLLEMKNSHKEWEMMDLRATKQRPGLSIRAFLDAVKNPVNAPGYTVEIDNDFLESQIVRNMWMILPYPTESKGSLQQTASPADYLVSIIKMFGLKMLIEGDGKTIRILTNSAFFTQTVVDISSRIGMDTEHGIQPCLADHKYYLFETEANGAFAKEYKEKFARTYGTQKVNTGYEFDEESTNLLQSFSFKGAADAIDTSVNYGSTRSITGGVTAPALLVTKNEECKFEVYKYNPSGYDSQTVNVPMPTLVTDFWDMTRNGLPFSLLQLRDSSQKPVDASGVLCLLTGFSYLPVRSGDINRWHLSDDQPLQKTMTGGDYCWDLRVHSSEVIKVTRIPIFRRTDVSKNISLEFGLPLETATDEDLEGIRPVYDDWWKRFISDRYDKDTRKINLKVDLSGFQVGQEMLRQFYYFGGAYWSLNKIINHSLTTYDLTECEFIKIQDKHNYELAPIKRTYITVDKTRLSFPSSAGARTFTITSKGTWNIVRTPESDLACNVYSGGASGEVTTTEVMVGVTTNTGANRRNWEIIITGENGDQVTVYVEQSASQSLLDVYEVDRDACIGCGECIPVCPVSCIELVDGLAEIDKDACIACGFCAEACPVGCINRVTRG